jgi:SAM-dependent methyltransferase
MGFVNIYEDARRAESYAQLDFPGTYYLAFRDLPDIFSKRVRGRRAVDFGCGAGRSTRFLRRLGFEAVGVDISADMVRMAKRLDPKGDYRLVADGDFSGFDHSSFDLVFSAFTFDNIPTAGAKRRNFKGLRDLLAADGRFVNLVSSPEIYTHEWASFTTKEFPQNRTARSGDKVLIVMTDVPDRRPVEDVVWSHEDYLKLYSESGLAVEEVRRPLGRDEEPVEWVNETRIAPWVIYVLKNDTS